MKVRAIRLGYYAHKRRPEGSVFILEPLKRIRPVKDSDGKPTGEMKEIVISPEQQFSKNWMEKVDPETPEKIIVTQKKITPKSMADAQKEETT
jgi:hypothetical protein